MFGTRILILAPHPDDEVVGFAVAIGRAQAAGAKVFVLFLTNGCAPRAALWPWQRPGYAARVACRRAEAEKAAAFLDVSIAGFAERPSRTLRHELTAVRAEIEACIEKNAIDQLWVPAYEGGHADHDALNGLAHIWKNKRAVLEFAEYNFFQGRANAQEFPRPNGTETMLVLTPEEIEKKRAALALYASERGNLDYVGLQKETFRPLASYDYAAPPHEGVLWYARFQWIPIRHPRVDFTTPCAVSDAILAQTSALLESARTPSPAHKG